jgi:hypothetical protein
MTKWPKVSLRTVDDVLRRHDVEHVEDEPILGEYPEIDAVAADAVGGEANCIGGDDRGSLLG